MRKRKKHKKAKKASKIKKLRWGDWLIILSPKILFYFDDENKYPIWW